MPRSDADKLNEEQTSLPTAAATTTTTATIIASELSDEEILNRITADIARTAFQLQQLERSILAREEQRLQEQKQQQYLNASIDNIKTTLKTTETKPTSATHSHDYSVNLAANNNIVLNFEQQKTTSITTTTITTKPTTRTTSHIYPKIVELQDQPLILKTASDTSAESLEPESPESSSLKRKRPRRIYAAESDRRATLRTRKIEQVPESTPPLSPTAALANLTPPTTPTRTENKQQVPTELTPEYLSPETWNFIEQIDFEEPKSTTRRKRGNQLGGRKRSVTTRASAQSPSSTIIASLDVSPSTAAAIAAAQFELDSSPTTSGPKKKRTRNMSLYDRRYQTNVDDRRGGVGVGNGYMSTSTRNSSAGSVSGAHTDIADAQQQDMPNQYYMSASSNSTGSNVGLNGSVALNHAPSMGTLCNIGNTCYLNSVVYTLRFAPHFLHNLHHLMHDLSCIQQTILRQRSAKSASLGRGVSAAHLENARSWSSKDLVSLEHYNGGGSNGTGNGGNSGSTSTFGKTSHQSLTEKLHDLYQSLHRNEISDSSEPHHADTLLHAIQDVNATFEGNQQQDAHEFLMCVLNSLRETNQTLIKAIGECPDVIANGYIVNPDEVDAQYTHDRDNSTSAGSSVTSSVQPTTSSSLSSKASFFSRKSKRKEEAKASKSSRLQSPLKDSNSPTGSSIGHAQSTVSNSLFYLNTVDLSGASAATSTASIAATATAAAATTNTATSNSSSAVVKLTTSDDEATTTINMLKDKARLEEKIRELNLDFFSEDFEGIVVLTTKCLSCETITKQKQGMLDISVPVPISGGAYDNTEYIEKPSAYIQNSCITREYFRGENKYSCDQCTGYTEAIRSISYEVLPRLLVIQLNRFSGGMEKINTYVPTTFTLPCFCAKCCELSDANKLHVYKLYSVITHVGATLSVGHYIAYTCCLDWANEYVNCPKDRRNMSPNQQQPQQPTDSSQTNLGGGGGGGGSGTCNSNSTTVSAATSAASALASSGTSLMKKMKFGRSKASSSGDMSKNVKQLNGITSKTITNGIGKLTMNTTCHGVNCCAMSFTRSTQQSQSSVNVAVGGSNSASSSDFSEESVQNGTNSSLTNYNNSAGSGSTSYSTGYGSTGRSGSKLNYAATIAAAEPIWYMCDDDKIKAMTQREFEELLSPTRKITITPYLLFYARFDLQPTPPAKQTTPTPTPPHTATWSNESLQSSSGVHKI